MVHMASNGANFILKFVIRYRVDTIYLILYCNYIYLFHEFQILRVSGVCSITYHSRHVWI